MKAVVRVDAAPGYEASVEASLRRVKGVTALGRQKERNFDLVVQVEVADADVLERLLANELRTISGVKGVERVEQPDPGLLESLKPLG